MQNENSGSTRIFKGICLLILCIAPAERWLEETFYDNGNKVHPAHAQPV
jgi:hypothetical protein